MRVCIPIAFRAQGGGHYFLRALAAWLEARGHAVTDDADGRYDVLFTNHWLVSRREVLRALRRNPGVRLAQRIDGAAQDYGRTDDADARQRAVNLLADLTIFQSEYARWATREKFPVIVRDGPVITNPVDVDVFTPDGPSRELGEGPRVACVTWSTNPLKGAASIYETARLNPDVAFVLCGRYPDAPDLPNLHAQGVLEREPLATTLRSCDALLTYSQNEACPNHVIEALATGLPVLYHRSGATPDLVGEHGAAVDPSSFRAELDRVVGMGEALRRRTRAYAVERFHPDVVFGRYLDALQAARARPTAVPQGRRWLRAWWEPALGRIGA